MRVVLFLFSSHQTKLRSWQLVLSSLPLFCSAHSSFPPPPPHLSLSLLFLSSFYEEGGFSTLALDDLTLSMGEVLAMIIRKRRLQIHGRILPPISLPLTIYRAPLLAPHLCSRLWIRTQGHSRNTSGPQQHSQKPQNPWFCPCEKPRYCMLVLCDFLCWMCHFSLSQKPVSVLCLHKYWSAVP